jgi:C1A family cysteine protease
MKLYTCILVLVACLYNVQAARFSEQQSQGLFSAFTQRYNRTYAIQELFERFNLFKANLEFVAEHNAQKDNTFTVAINGFADMSEEEWQRHKGLKVPEGLLEGKLTVDPQNRPDQALLGITPKPAVDWRKEGVVNNPVNQHSCGSCYAFAAASAIESAWAISGRGLKLLSPQQMVDCVRTCNGCGGGWMTLCFDWVIQNHGVCSWSVYPYRNKQTSCKACRQNTATVLGYYDLQGQSEDVLVKGLNLGPVTVAVQSQSRGFMFYKSGVVANK